MLSNKGKMCVSFAYEPKKDTTKLGSNVVQELKINQRRILIDSLEIGIPSPEQMMALGERQLPNGVKVGQLLNSKTLNYKKLTPHRDGLFCERIFGPVQSFVCACGKKKESVQSKNKNKDSIKKTLLPSPSEVNTLDTGINLNKGSLTPQTDISQASCIGAPTRANENEVFVTATLTQEADVRVPFCPKCQVEYISKNVRRHRLGHIKLFSPVTHIWYLKGRPSYLSLFLGKRKKVITSLAYCNAYLVEQIDSNLKTETLLKNSSLLSFSTKKHKISSVPYIRAQSLPFLPSLISPFHLRDSLISFLQSLPCAEDIPIPIYCQTTRRYPLSDVHKFLAESRSVNQRNQTERLTDSSIAKFLGGTKQIDLMKPFYSKNRSTSSAFLKKKRCGVFVHKSHDIHFSYRSLVKDKFKQNLNKTLFCSVLLNKQEKNTKQMHAKQSFAKQTSFWRARIKASTGEYVTLATNPIECKTNFDVVKATFCNQSKRYQQKEFYGTTQKKRVTTQSEIGGNKANKSFCSPKLALLPLTLSLHKKKQTNKKSVPTQADFFAANQRLCLDNCKQGLTKLEQNKVLLCKSGISPAYAQIKLPRSRSLKLCFGTFHPSFKKSFTYAVPFLPQEKRISLRGVLLKSFLKMIEKECTHLFFSFKSKLSFQDGVKRIHNISKKETFLDAKLSQPTSVLTELKKKVENGKNFADIVFVKQNKDELTKVDFFKGKKDNQIENPLQIANSKSKKLQLQLLLPSLNKSLSSSNISVVSPLQNFREQNQAFVPDTYSKNNQKGMRVVYAHFLPKCDTQLFSTLFHHRKNINIQKSCITFVSKGYGVVADKNPNAKLTYVYLPTLLYLQNINSERYQIKISEILFLCLNGFSALKRGSLLPFKMKSLGTQNCNVNKVEPDQNPILKKNPFVLQKNENKTKFGFHFAKFCYRNVFAKKMDSYQSRLLHIVFEALSSYQNSNSASQAIKDKTKVPQLHRIYLLTKHKPEQKQNRSLAETSFQYQKTKLDYAFLLESSQERKTVAYSNKTERNRSFVNFGYKVVHTLLRSNPSQIKKVSLLRAQSEALRYKKEKKIEQKKRHELFPLFSSNSVEPGFAKNLSSSDLTSPTSFGSESLSKWQTNAAKEILLYTGGGALESLLKRFHTALFCQFLFHEIQILRKHYKDQILGECKNNSMAAFPFDLRHSELSSEKTKELSRNRYNTCISKAVVNENEVFVTAELMHARRAKLDQKTSFSKSSDLQDTFEDPERELRYKYLVSEKGANLFCRRIYRTTRRLKIVQLLMRGKRRPEWMMISVLPVLPPDLRPVLQMGDNVIVASDLNTLYQRVIYRNNRHYKGRFLDFHFVSSIHRLVQDAVDRLIENGKGGSTPFLTPSGRPLKSLSDILKGKRGRFRFNLLGKRVDFSGRSVIVVSPNLKIHECGLPREMALELYKYLLIRQLFLQKKASSIVNAKKLIKQRKPFIWDVLRQIIYYHPLLLNRAPTLHRLGIQAFQPKLSLGNAILLHPLVCAGFNADFDGDQMGVHLPLSPQARAEAWDLLWSRNNLLSPATGQPILLPSQDMVLGFYYMTSLLPYNTANKTLFSSQFAEKKKEISTSVLSLNKLLSGSRKSFSSTKELGTLYSDLINKKYKNKTNLPIPYVFSDKDQVIYAYQKKQIDIHTPIWYKWLGKSENGEKSQIPLELRIDMFGHKTQMYSRYHYKSQTYKDANTSQRFALQTPFSFHIRTTVGRVLVNNLMKQNKEAN